jgi:HD-GYP domain-containing protein (c-di-GMP phosphodiesterase class II)
LSVTLIVEDNPMIEGLYSLNLKTWMDQDTYWCSSTTDAIDLMLSKTVKVNLIISRCKINNEESGKVILDFLRDQNLSIPVILVGLDYRVKNAFAEIKNSLHLRPIIQASAKALGITAKQMSEKIVPDFFPIPIHFFKSIQLTTVDVYKEDPQEEGQYHKEFEENSVINSGILNQLISTGMSHLFVEKLRRLEFVNFVSQEYISSIEISKLNADEKITATEGSFLLLSKKLVSFGISGETLALTNKNLNLVKNNVRGYPKLYDLLDLMMRNESGYLFKHTQILTCIAIHIIKHIDWGNQSQEEMISFISYFHDVYLQTEEEAKISNEEELKKATLSMKARARVEKHAQLAGELLAKFPHTPMGADQIVKQHHGSLNGIGFTDYFSGNLSPASVVLIVAEEVTRILLEHEDKPLSTQELIAQVKQKLPNARLQKIIKLLESLTL